VPRRLRHSRLPPTSQAIHLARRAPPSGYWLGGSVDGYGYPLLGFGYGYSSGAYPITTAATSSDAVAPATRSTAEPATNDYGTARPGYEVRTLIASANILAQHGQQQACEDVLATTRDVYKHYAADMRGRDMPAADVPDWRQRQIATAKPVTSETASFRSDELVGTDVRSPTNQALGSVQDLVMSPHTDRIAYLVIGRGGIFGIGETYVPVPWTDFKAPSGMSVLVLDTTNKAMEAAPRVNHDQFTTGGHFDQLSQEVGAYWKAHLSKDTSGNSND
jgi:sporulation protein YlmC with PRC-barrel domain